MRATLPVLILVAGACSPPPTVDAGLPDAGIDAGVSCSQDAHCASGFLCTTGSCLARTPHPDGGGFACTRPCDCLQGEWCESDRCVTDPIGVTRFLGQGGSGDGKTSVDPAGNLAQVMRDGPDHQVFALRANDTFSNDGPFTVNGDDITLIGGYAECVPGRWVRNPSAQSTLATDAGTVLAARGKPLTRLHDIHVQNLSLRPTGCGSPLVDGDALDAPLFERLQPDIAACNAHFELLRCDQCEDALIRSLVLAMPSTPAASSFGITLLNGSGTIANTRLLPSTTEMDWAIAVLGATGPVTIRDSQLDVTSSIGTAILVSGLDKTTSVRIAGNTIRVRGVPSVAGFIGIGVRSLLNVEVENNVIAPVGGSLAVSAVNIGVEAENVDWLTLTSNDLGLFAPTGSESQVGVKADVAVRSVALIRNRVSGGGAGPAFGLMLGGEELVARGNVIDVVGGGITRALGTTTSSGVRAEGNVFRARASGCSASNQIFGGDFTYASGNVELVSNVFTATSCSGTAKGVSVGGGHVWLLGNTIEARAADAGALATGVACQATPLPVFQLEAAVGNIVGGGVFDTFSSGPCTVPTAWRSNSFWLNEHVAIVQADAGTRDVRNNLYNGNVSCFADAGTYRLAPGSPCVDTGELLYRSDGGLIEFDLDGLSRLDAGLPDIGASELH